MCDMGNRCVTAMGGSALALQHGTLDERTGQ